MTQEELEAKVIRCYKKNMPLTMIANLGICGQTKASEILKRHGILNKSGKLFELLYGRKKS